MSNSGGSSQRLDYNLKSYRDRTNCVEKILENKSLQEAIALDFEKYAVLSQGDELATDSNISQILESMATYLLKADCEKEDALNGDKKNRQEIRTIEYNTEMLNKKNAKDYRLISSINPSVSEDKLSLSEIRKHRIFKVDTRHKITKEDIENNEYLKGYEVYLNGLLKQKEILKTKINNGAKLTDDELRKLYLIQKIIPIIREDMMFCYLSEKRPIKFKAPLKESYSIDYESLDMSDFSTVKALLPLIPNELEFFSDLNIILLDLDILISEIDFTDEQSTRLNMYRNGMKITEIADTLNVSKQAVSQSIDTCVNKIVKAYNKKFADWYYLNICKGNYYVCTACGKTVLAMDTKIHNSKIICNKCWRCKYGK